MDRRLEHLQRRGVGRALCAARLAVDARDLRHRLDQAIGLLQQLGRFPCRQSWQCRRHVQQVAFVQPRHELAADVPQRPQAGSQHHERHHERELRGAQHPVEQRPVDRDQQAIERIVLLVGDAATDQVAHEHRDQGHRQACRSRHGVGLGERQRGEQASFLRFQCEHRHEGQRDDQQREKQRRPHLRRRFADDVPSGRPFKRLARVFMAPMLQMLMGVLDHHHRRVDHRTDGDRDAPQRHDVGVDALVVHHDERRQDAQGQRDDGDQRRAQVEQEEEADHRNDDEFLNQLVREVLHCAFDQPRAVVDRHDLHTSRQAGRQALELALDRSNGLQRVLSRAHHDHAADGLSLAVEFADAAPHFRTDLHPRYVAQTHRHAGGCRHERHLPKIFQAPQVARGAHHVLGLAEFEHRAARLLVRALDRLHDLGVRDAVGRKLVRIEHDLVLAHHAAHGSDLGHVGHGLQLVLEKPVLQRAQLRDVHLAAAVDQRILVDPTDAGRVWTQ